MLGRRIIIPIFITLILGSGGIFLWSKNRVWVEKNLDSTSKAQISFLSEEESIPQTKEDETFAEKEELIEKTQVNEEISQESEKSISEITENLNPKPEEATEKEEDEKSEEETKKETKESFCQKISTNQPAKNKVIINEVAWMGTDVSFNSEWIELKNISQNPINLSGWQLIDKEKDIKIIFEKTDFISASGFFLLERNNDNSVPEISADKIYKGSLTNSNEALFLFGPNCLLEDEVLAEPDWPAGDNATKRTMERKPDFSWQTSKETKGTPRKENSAGWIKTEPEEPLPETEDNSSSTSSFAKILISEIKISEERGDKDIFVEFFNPNNFEIDLTNWYLQRKTEGALEFSSFVSKNLFAGKKILAKSYFLLVRQSSSFEGLADILFDDALTENNSLSLKNPNRQTVDEISWQIIPVGRSFGRVYDENTQSYGQSFEVQALSPKEKNNLFPIANFSFFPANPELGQEIFFDASASLDTDGLISFYAWNFGDNFITTTTQSTLSHSFLNSGSFLVSLFVVDKRGATSSLATTTIFISEKIPNQTEEENQTQPEENQEENFLSVVINEVAWMGTGSSSALRADEWIELYNNTSKTIDLTGWALIFLGNASSSITLTGEISPFGFYLLERTDDNTIGDVSADWYGSFGDGLNNNGGKLELRDKNNLLIDEIDCSAGWFAGKASPDYISMERVNPKASGNDSNNWKDNNLIIFNGINALGGKINGTPKNPNSVSSS